ncbi:hypothetical protein DPEC_G00316850 [Dallia pectoralis]|uniref:Uncharacterized protein n=1 Tax=Dallia pectoralis TaxID=75939 RepID=A0ACC2FCQ0_DALPE|nr:hypothetical protein DPEC_G00316850 [Dallia pectoralis]
MSRPGTSTVILKLRGGLSLNRLNGSCRASVWGSQLSLIFSTVEGVAGPANQRRHSTAGPGTRKRVSIWLEVKRRSSNHMAPRIEARRSLNYPGRPLASTARTSDGRSRVFRNRSNSSAQSPRYRPRRFVSGNKVNGVRLACGRVPFLQAESM